ncbi:hypothetical protein TNCV_3842641 [Trichonephila clavipes]|nr:hypothetical protein TNCV_3842641 [Trichonephila clavipes]
MQKIDSCPVDFRHGRHGKYPLGARYLGVECLDALGKIKFLRTNFASAKLRCLPLGKKLGDKITYGNWYRLSSAALKVIPVPGNVLDLQRFKYQYTAPLQEKTIIIYSESFYKYSRTSILRTSA